MTSKLPPVPSAARLEQLLGELYGSEAGPDQARLALTYGQLKPGLRKRRRTLSWWLMGPLLAGAAAAAWWAADQLTDREGATPAATISKPSTEESTVAAPKPQPSDAKPNNLQRSPVIDRREPY